MKSLIRRLLSLVILGTATVLYLMLKVLLIIFFPIAAVVRYVQNKRKYKILSFYKSSGLKRISLSDVFGDYKK